MWAVICRSNGVLSANENDGDNESNDSPIYYNQVQNRVIIFTK